MQACVSRTHRIVCDLERERVDWKKNATESYVATTCGETGSFRPTVRLHSRIAALALELDDELGRAWKEEALDHEASRQALATLLMLPLQTWREMVAIELSDPECDDFENMHTLVLLVRATHRVSCPKQRHDGLCNRNEGRLPPDRWECHANMTSACVACTVAPSNHLREEGGSDSPVTNLHAERLSVLFSSLESELLAHRETEWDAKAALRRCAKLAFHYSEEIAASVRSATLSSRPLSHAISDVPVDTAVESLVSKADADMGSQVFRDMLLSFVLPASVVGLRHTLLLSRESTNVANRSFSKVVDYAHSAALVGPSRVWEYGSPSTLHADILQSALDHKTDTVAREASFLDSAERMHATSKEAEARDRCDPSSIAGSELERACVLLAGLAMVFAPSAIEARKGVAFRGHVRLPFLYSHPLADPSRFSMATCLELQQSSDWVFTTPRSGRVSTRNCGSGLEGLRVGAALLLNEFLSR